VQSYPELRLHFAGLIASVINSVPRGQGRMLLFTPVSRQSLFYLFANWCGLFGQRVDVEVRSRNPQLSYNSLQAMSALLCCGPVFQANGLDKSSAIYRWLDNMLNCGEARVGWQSVCCLRCPELPAPVLHRCRPSAARPCNCCCTTTAALPLSCTGSLTVAMTAKPVLPSSASTPSPTQLPACGWLWLRLGGVVTHSSSTPHSPDYPCDMVTLLHVVLFKTGDSEHSTRERATQLLQLLDRRFLAENGYTRPELWGCLTGGAYSQCHVTFSRELATTNPELTFPLFCGKL